MTHTFLNGNQLTVSLARFRRVFTSVCSQDNLAFKHFTNSSLVFNSFISHSQGIEKFLLLILFI